MEGECCIPGCTRTGTLVTATNVGITALLNASKKRGDNLHSMLEEKLQSSDYCIEYHKDCVSTYKSSWHIDNYVKKYNLPVVMWKNLQLLLSNE